MEIFYEIIQAGYPDIPVIHALAKRIWNEYYPAIISQEQIDYMLGKMYADSSLMKQMDEGHIFWLLKTENQIAGYCSLHKQTEGKYYLNKLYIDTNLHRSGIGRIFLNEVLTKYPDLEELRLAVNRKNFKAINYYFKNGFTIESTGDFDIGDGYFMNDFIMVKRFADKEDGR